MPAGTDFFLFVSHVAEDRAAALKVVDELERRGLRCWIAPRDVHPGRPFDDEIVEAIEGSRAMLLIFSDHCNDSDYIRREVTVAGESHKLIIPFRIEDVPPRRGLRVRLSDLHWIDGFASRERAIDQVIRTVGPASAALYTDVELAKQAEGNQRPEEARREAETTREAESTGQAEADRAEQLRRAKAARVEAETADAGEVRQANQRPMEAAAFQTTERAAPRINARPARRGVIAGGLAAALAVVLIIVVWQAMPFHPAPAPINPVPVPANPTPAPAPSVGVFAPYDGPGYHCVSVRPKASQSADSRNNAEIILDDSNKNIENIVRDRAKKEGFSPSSTIINSNSEDDIRAVVLITMSGQYPQMVIFCGSRIDLFEKVYEELAPQ